jgi:hypothetical protein
MTIHFTEHPTTPLGALTRDAAIEAAGRTGPDLAGDTNITARCGVMTNEDMYSTDSSTGDRTYVAKDRLVWLIRFGDRETPSFGNPNLPPQRGLDVVLDAMTGGYLFACAGTASDL